jgi:hypothetical protein
MATPTTLPASFVAGNVLEASQLNNLRGAFRVLQVVTAATGTSAVNTTTTLADTTLTVSITPQSATSKILVYVSQNGILKVSSNVGSGTQLLLLRNATPLTYFATGVGYTNSTAESLHSASCVYLDSPATTSAVTYKTQYANIVAASLVAVQGAASVPVGNPNSYICVMEISA